MEALLKFRTLEGESKVKSRNLLKTLGPGILFASTAIGVSHLVQSTQAGANFGFGLLWAILLANLLKYPFFEFGSRYANLTGTSIIDGYKKIGKWALIGYIIVTAISMFLVCSAVGKVTSGFMENLFHLNELTGIDNITVILLFIVCFLILFFGKYKVLDKLIKILGLVLLVTTLTAFGITLFKGPVAEFHFFNEENAFGTGAMTFVIPLMGWMPTAVDLSAWNSLWTIERVKETGYKPSLKETLFDFNFGYIVSALLAICFLTLGAYLMFETGKEFSPRADKFAGQVISLYTKNMGSWSYILIASAAFSIMFSTCIAVFDGYSRAAKRSIELLFKNEVERPFLYRLFIGILMLGSLITILVFNQIPKGFKLLVDIATTVSFIVAPVIAIFNYILVQKKHTNRKLPIWLHVLSILGIVFLFGFGIYFLVK